MTVFSMLMFLGGAAVTAVLFWVRGAQAGCPAMIEFIGDLFGTKK